MTFWSIAASAGAHAAALGGLGWWTAGAARTGPTVLFGEGDQSVEVQLPLQEQAPPGTTDPWKQRESTLEPASLPRAPSPPRTWELDPGEVIDVAPHSLPAPPEPPARAVALRQGASVGGRPHAKVHPEYPESCQRDRHEGTTVLECDLDRSGGVTRIWIRRSAGCADLDAAAREATIKAGFDPAREDGIPVPCRVIQPVEFKLKGGG